MESESSVCKSARVSLSQMSPPTEYSDGVPGNDEQPGCDELCSRIRGIHTSMKRVHPEHKEDILAVSSSHLVWKGCSAFVPTRQKNCLSPGLGRANPYSELTYSSGVPVSWYIASRRLALHFSTAALEGSCWRYHLL